MLSCFLYTILKWAYIPICSKVFLNIKEYANCVRKVDDLLNVLACHTTYRDLLRSSSAQEPRYPPLGAFKSLFSFFFLLLLITMNIILIDLKKKIN